MHICQININITITLYNQYVMTQALITSYASLVNIEEQIRLLTTQLEFMKKQMKTYEI